MLLGLGTPIAAVAAVFHILNHATFKAALFMCAGIIDHEAGTRDIRRLGGLLTLMPITATLAIDRRRVDGGATPYFNGFLSKEMMLEAGRAHGLCWLCLGSSPCIATLAALLSAAYSYRFAISTFLGKPARRLSAPKQPHDPPIGMWLARRNPHRAGDRDWHPPCAIPQDAIVERTALAVVARSVAGIQTRDLARLDVPALWMSVIALGRRRLAVRIVPRRRCIAAVFSAVPMQSAPTMPRSQVW